jgi:DNA-binding CsgD family transcriptional regulator/tetratricopeptide (TPR) repeat protein
MNAFDCAVQLLLAVLLLGGSVSGLDAQAVRKDPLLNQLIEEPNRLQFNPILMRERSDALLEFALANEDCDSLHLAAFLSMQADVVMNQSHDAAPFEPSWACDWRHAPLFYIRGVLLYNENDFDAAALDFQRAASAAGLYGSKDQEIFALHALGSVEMSRQNHHVALGVYEKAYALAPELHLPTHLNNLAYASYIVGDCAGATQWCDLAEEQLQIRSEELPPAYFVGDKNAILLTRLLVALSQADRALMQDVVGQIKFQDPFASREMIAITAVTQALQATNRPRAFEALRPIFESWLSESDSTEIAENFGANRRLFHPWQPASEPVDPGVWSELRGFPPVLRGLASVQCNGSSNATDLPHQGADLGWMPWQWVAWVLSVLALLSAWLLVRQWRFHRALLATFDAAPAAHYAMLNQALFLASARQPILRGRALIALRMLRHQNAMADLADEGLSGQERLAVLELRSGRRPEVVAQVTGLSSRAVRALAVRFSAALKVIIVVFSSVTLASAAELTIPADSAFQWLIQGDSSAWFSAIASDAQWSPDPTIPDVVGCAFLPREQRPDWAQMSDQRLWQELRHVLSIIEEERSILEGAFVSTLNPEIHVQFLRSAGSTRWLKWSLWAGGIFAFLVIASAKLIARNRRIVNSISEDGQAIDAVWGRGEDESAKAWLESLQSESFRPSDGGSRWELLNASEQEVAIYLASGLNVSTIADRMSCTTRYIYNIRSAIRKKWDLGTDDDLIGAIRAHQPVG